MTAPTIPARSRGPRSRRPAPPRRPGRALLRAVSWHRRPLAAVAAALAVLTGVSAALPEGPSTVEVMVAVQQLPGGSVIEPEDLELRAVRATDVPDGAVAEPSRLTGQVVAAPVAQGQVLTELALAIPRRGPGAGRVLAPVRLADAAVVALLRPGDVVDLVGTDDQGGAAAVVARSVRVVTVPAVGDTETTRLDGGLVLVSVSPTTATALAGAAAGGVLTPVWR